MLTSDVQLGNLCPRGGSKLSRLEYLAPTQDLGQAE